MSHLSKDEVTAIHAYANGWDKDGNAVYRCAKCEEPTKRRFGCGFDSRFAGKCQLKMTMVEGVDYHNTCPGWWRQQPFILDLITMRDWKANLGHPMHVPHRLLDAMSRLEALEYEEQKKRMEDLRSK